MRPPAVRNGKERAARWILLLLVAVPFLVRPSIVGGDEPHYALMASSLAFDRDIDLRNQYEAVANEGSSEAGKRFRGRELDRHLVPKANGLQFSHPLGLPAIAAPAVAIARNLLRLPYPDLALGALAIAFCYFGLWSCGSLAGLYLDDRIQGLVLAATLLASTPLWYYCRTFFTEPFAWSLLAIGCALIAQRRAFWGGLALGLGLLVREPTLMLSIPILGGAWFYRGRRASLLASVGLALGATGVLLRNRFVNGGGWLDFPQPFQYGNLVDGSLGLLFDRAHGVLLFAPLVALAPAALFLSRTGAERVGVALCLGGTFATFLLAAAWSDWRGGSCFGPRLILPALPFLGFPLCVVWKNAPSRMRSVWIALAALGTGIELVAIADPFRAFWSVSLPLLIGDSVISFSLFVAGTLGTGWALARVAARAPATPQSSLQA